MPSRVTKKRAHPRLAALLRRPDLPFSARLPLAALFVLGPWGLWTFVTGLAPRYLDETTAATGVTGVATAPAASAAARALGVAGRALAAALLDAGLGSLGLVTLFVGASVVLLGALTALMLYLEAPSRQPPHVYYDRSKGGPLGARLRALAAWLDGTCYGVVTSRLRPLRLVVLAALVADVVWLPWRLIHVGGKDALMLVGAVALLAGLTLVWGGTFVTFYLLVFGRNRLGEAARRLETWAWSRPACRWQEATVRRDRSLHLWWTDTARPQLRRWTLLGLRRELPRLELADVVRTLPARGIATVALLALDLLSPLFRLANGAVAYGVTRPVAWLSDALLMATASLLSWPLLLLTSAGKTTVGVFAVVVTLSFFKIERDSLPLVVAAAQRHDYAQVGLQALAWAGRLTLWVWGAYAVATQYKRFGNGVASLAREWRDLRLCLGRHDRFGAVRALLSGLLITATTLMIGYGAADLVTNRQVSGLLRVQVVPLVTADEAKALLFARLPAAQAQELAAALRARPADGDATGHH